MGGDRARGEETDPHRSQDRARHHDLKGEELGERDIAEKRGQDQQRPRHDESPAGDGKPTVAARMGRIRGPLASAGADGRHRNEKEADQHRSQKVLDDRDVERGVDDTRCAVEEDVEREDDDDCGREDRQAPGRVIGDVEKPPFGPAGREDRLHDGNGELGAGQQSEQCQEKRSDPRGYEAEHLQRHIGQCRQDEDAYGAQDDEAERACDLAEIGRPHAYRQSRCQTRPEARRQNGSTQPGRDDEGDGAHERHRSQAPLAVRPLDDEVDRRADLAQALPVDVWVQYDPDIPAHE